MSGVFYNSKGRVSDSDILWGLLDSEKLREVEPRLAAAEARAKAAEQEVRRLRALLKKQRRRRKRR